MASTVDFKSRRRAQKAPGIEAVDKGLVERMLLSGISKKMLDPGTLDRIVKKANEKLKMELSRKHTGTSELESQRQEIAEQVDNLTGFIMKGNHSVRVSALLAQKEEELANIERRLETVSARGCSTARPIPASWVRTQVENLEELFEQYPDKTYLLRQEIKKGLTGKIVMRPCVSKSEQRCYLAEVNADPLSLWGTTSAGSLIGHSATGIRTPV